MVKKNHLELLPIATKRSCAALKRAGGAENRLSSRPSIREGVLDSTLHIDLIQQTEDQKIERRARRAPTELHSDSSPWGSR